MDHVDRMQVRDLIEELQRHDPNMRVKLGKCELLSVLPTLVVADNGLTNYKVLVLSDRST